MPTEQIAEPDVTEEREFGTSLEEIFKEKMPGGLTIDQEDEQPVKEEAPKKEPVKPDEPKKRKSVEREEPVGITDVLQKIPGSVERVPEQAEDEPKKPEAPPEIKGKSREHWEKLATEKWESDKKARALEKKAKELEQKLTESGADVRVKQLEGLVKDYSSRLERVGLEHHPWFEANFVVPKNNLIDSAKRALKAAGGDPQAITKALRLDGAARVEQLDNILGEISSTSVRSRVERAIDDIDQLEQRKEQVLANRDVVMKQLVDNDKVSQKQMFENHAKQTKAELSEAKEILRDKFGFFIFKTVDDPQYSWWNEEVKKMDSESENLMLNTTDRKELTLAANMAVAAPRIMNLLVKEVAARKKIEKEFSEYKSSEPKLGGGARKSRALETEEEETDKPLVQSILDHIHGNT